MYLFNPYRNAQQVYATGDTVLKVNWKTDLNTNPVYGAESSAVTDEFGNIYFGSHSGNFYSLTKEGEIRWVFSTSSKIYSSPLLIDSKVIFAGGDGFLYSLAAKNGELIWKRDLSESLNLTRKKKALSLLKHLPYTLDLKRKKNIIYKSWASPNLLNNKIYITGYGKGLYCFQLDGKLLWEYDLGFPRYQLSGVAVDGDYKIYCSSRKGWIHCLDESGKLIWERKVTNRLEPWGNPVYFKKNNTVYFSFSNKENKGSLYAYSSQGDFIWKLKLGPIRGSAVLTKDGSILYVCDLDGFIYKVDTITGKVLLKKKITQCARGLWITPTLDADENILLATKDSIVTGRVIKLNPDFNSIWEHKTNKVLSIPVILSNGDVLFGSWDGYYYSIKTKQ